MHGPGGAVVPGAAVASRYFARFRSRPRPYEKHGSDQDDQPQERAQARDQRRAAAQPYGLLAARRSATGRRAELEIVEQLQDQHAEDRGELQAQEPAKTRAPEYRAPKVGVENTTEVQIENAGDQQDSNGDPANQAETFAQLLRSEEHTSELQSLAYLVCRLLLEK